MRVLVAGVGNAVDVALVGELVAAPEVELVIAAGSTEALTRLAATSGRLIALEVDLARSRCAHDLLFGAGAEHRIDRVVHTLAARPHPRGRASPADLARELVLSCERHPTIRQLVVRSVADVYALRAEPNLVDEDQPFELDPSVPDRVRALVEADLAVACRGGRSALAVTILRCAEVVAPGAASQLWDYLRSRVCLRPLGFDPMLNVLSLDDAVRAVVLALRAGQAGVFNIPGADTLPLSRVVARAGRHGLPLPGPLIGPLYRLRARTVGLEFRYDLNLRRFHFGGMLDGSRARAALGYAPTVPVGWPRPAAGRADAALAAP